MRFHMGISFRFKTLKKFLIPFLIGLLSYFGFSYFNMLVVNAAWNNPNSYFIYDIPDSESIDFPNIRFGNYTLDQLVNASYSYTNSYIPLPVVNYQKSTGKTTLYLFVLNNASTYVNYTTYMANNSSGSQFFSNIKSSTSSLRVFTINTESTDESIETFYTNSVRCFSTSNSCPSSSVQSYNLPNIQVPTSVTDPNDIDLNTGDNYNFVYKSHIPVYFQRNSSTSNSNYYKSFKYNGDVLVYGDRLPYYMDYYIPPNPGGLFWTINDMKHIDDVFVSKVDKTDISNLSVDIRFKYYDNVLPDELDYQTYYYGRKNNGTYYSYEKINCLRDGSITYDSSIDNNYKVVYSNFRCSSDLTNYDYIYIRFRPYYQNVTNPYVSNKYFETNYGYITQTKSFNGSNFIHLVDYFDNLSVDFNLLVSTSSDKQYVNFKSDDSSIIMSSVNRKNEILSNLAVDYDLLFGVINNTNVMIYNLNLELNSLNPLFVFISDESIISFRDTNTNTFTYYDDTNTLVQGDIENTYQVVHDVYDLSYYFNRVNNFINDIDNDLLSFHNLVQTCYSSLDVSIQLIINVLYILGLSYLLFKALRK